MSGAPTSDTSSTPKECKFCGTVHVWGRKKCPAYGKKCSKCKRFNHYAKQCGEIGKKFHVNAVNDDSSA